MSFIENFIRGPNTLDCHVLVLPVDDVSELNVAIPVLVILNEEEDIGLPIINVGIN